MRGLTFNILSVAIIVLIIAVIGGLLLSQVNAADIGQYLTSTFTGCGRKSQDCCTNNWCVTGLTCSKGKCIEETFEIMLDETYLIYDPETATRNGRNYFFQSKTGLGEQDCSGTADECKNCSKIFNFTNATNCIECDICDMNNKTCEFCLSCDSAESNNYRELSDCLDCSDCINIDVDSLMAENCSNCSFCGYANVSTFIDDLSCSNCYQCGENINDECISCYDCNSEPYMTCDNCSRTASVSCKSKSDYQLCERVKECIMNYGEGECQIEELVPLPWDDTYSFIGTVSNVLKNCIKEDILKHLPEGGQQKICNFNTNIVAMEGDVNNDCIVDDADADICVLASGSKVGDPNWNPGCDLNDDGKITMLDAILLSNKFGNTCLEKHYFIGDNPSFVPIANLRDLLNSSSVTGENEGILFNDCGYEIIPSKIPNSDIFGIYSSKPELFSSSTVPRTPAPHNDIAVNLKIVVSNMSLREQTDNKCAYNIYLCAQEAIANDESDSILDFYGNFSYFNETYDIFQTQKWEKMYGSTQVNVTGTEYSEFIVNLSGRTADVQNIAKAIIAGLRDYINVNSFVNQTVGFFCVKNELNSDMNECYINNVSIVLNDKVPWKLEGFNVLPDPLSDIPDYKYIYYDDSKTSYDYGVGIVLTLFAYSSNISGLENKIFITPFVIIKPTSIVPSIPQCSDGIDNDLDGFCDLPASICTDGSTPGDPGCTGPADNDENDIPMSLEVYFKGLTSLTKNYGAMEPELGSYWWDNNYGAGIVYSTDNIATTADIWHLDGEPAWDIAGGNQIQLSGYQASGGWYHSFLWYSSDDSTSEVFECMHASKQAPQCPFEDNPFVGPFWCSWARRGVRFGILTDRSDTMPWSGASDPSDINWADAWVEDGKELLCGDKNIDCLLCYSDSVRLYYNDVANCAAGLCTTRWAICNVNLLPFDGAAWIDGVDSYNIGDVFSFEGTDGTNWYEGFYTCTNSGWVLWKVEPVP